MPRKAIQLPYTIEYLSILDEEAKLDKSLEPKIQPDVLKQMYRYMLLARRTDERMLNMQRQGRIGTFPQSSGHEAISAGSTFAVQATDWVVPAYRELAGMLYRGWPLESIFLYWGGFEEGARVPDGVNDLPMCVPVASQLLHAAGIGMAMNIREEKHVVLTYFGDGASSEGDCHEALNFAAVFNAPVVFICLNNQYAISVPISRQMKNETVAQRAIGYGMQGIRVDGNDALAVYQATTEAVERARSGGGPTLIECLTYRFTPHTTADDPKRYRTDEDTNTWKQREPLLRFTKYLTSKGILSAGELEKMEEEVSAQIKTAVQNMESLVHNPEYCDPLHMFDFVYAELPPGLQEQREELAATLKRDASLKTEAAKRHQPSPAQI